MSGGGRPSRGAAPGEPDGPPLPRRPAADPVLWVVLAAGTLARLAFVGEPLRNDESYSLLAFALRPFAEIVTDYHVPNNHLLHTILMRLSCLAFGVSELAVRLPALAFGIVLIPLAYRLGLAATGSRLTARYFAALAAASHWMVFYSANGRGYGVQAALGLGMGLVLLHGRSARRKAVPAALFALLAFACLYTIPSGAFFVVPMTAALFVAPVSGLGPRLAAGAALLAAALSAAAYLPVLGQAGTVEQAPGWSPAPALIEALASASAGLAPPWLLAALALVGAVALARRRDARWLIGLALAAPVLLEVLIRALRPLPPFFPRNYLVLVPWFHLLAAHGLACLVGGGAGSVLRRATGWTCLGLVVAYAAWSGSRVLGDRSRLFFPARPLAAECRDAARGIISTMMRPGDRILAAGSFDCEPPVIVEVLRSGRRDIGYGPWEREAVRGVYAVGPEEGGLPFLVERAFPAASWSLPETVYRGEHAVGVRLRRRD